LAKRATNALMFKGKRSLQLILPFKEGIFSLGSFANCKLKWPTTKTKTIPTKPPPKPPPMEKRERWATFARVGVDVSYGSSAAALVRIDILGLKDAMDVREQFKRKQFTILIMKTIL